jgi:hypothetical protein
MLAQWTTTETDKPKHHVRARRFVLLATVCLIAVIIPAATRFWPVQPTVDVSFITEPFGATICLDGKVLLQPDGTPYKTPCTVPRVPARSYRVSFKRQEAADLDIGQIDVAGVREVTARWDAGSNAR